MIEPQASIVSDRAQVGASSLIEPKRASSLIEPTERASSVIEHSAVANANSGDSEVSLDGHGWGGGNRVGISTHSPEADAFQQLSEAEGCWQTQRKIGRRLRGARGATWLERRLVGGPGEPGELTGLSADGILADFDVSSRVCSVVGSPSRASRGGVKFGATASGGADGWNAPAVALRGDGE